MPEFRSRQSGVRCTDAFLGELFKVTGSYQRVGMVVAEDPLPVGEHPATQLLSLVQPALIGENAHEPKARGQRGGVLVAKEPLPCPVSGQTSQPQ